MCQTHFGILMDVAIPTATYLSIGRRRFYLSTTIVELNGFLYSSSITVNLMAHGGKTTTAK